MPIAPARGSDRQPIIIAGAGIAGLTAALALAAAGFRVVVAERAEKLSELGAGIQIAPNAGRILATLGLDKAMAAVALEPEAIDIRNGASGRKLTSIPADAFRKRYGFPYRVIHRADLQSLLAAAVARRPAIRLQLGAVVEESMVQPVGLLVRLKRRDGSEVIQATAVIGADGVWSSHRAHIPGAAQPKPTGRTAWRALIPADVARSLTDMTRVGLWLGPDAHLVHYPVAQGSAVNVVAIIEETWDRPGWNAHGEPKDIAQHFSAWCKPARDLIAAPVAWQKFAIVAVDPAGPWTAGRVALIGDAAHAMTPFLAQGAAMAIEDAALLAASLYGATDIPAALAAYEAARKPRVARLAEASKRTGDTYHFGSTMAAVRNAALAIAGPRLIFGQSDWIYRWQPTPRVAAPA